MNYTMINNKNNVQTIIFDKTIYNYKEAIQFLYKHRFKAGKFDETLRYLRFRQKQPKKNYKYMTYDLQNGIKFILIINKGI